VRTNLGHRRQAPKAAHNPTTIPASDQIAHPIGRVAKGAGQRRRRPGGRGKRHHQRAHEHDAAELAVVAAVRHEAAVTAAEIESGAQDEAAQKDRFDGIARQVGEHLGGLVVTEDAQRRSGGHRFEPPWITGGWNRRSIANTRRRRLTPSILVQT
jgi:hypothetical protein